MQNNDQATFLLKLKILEEEMNEEDYSETIERHLDALVEDIENIEGVTNASSRTSGKIIEIKIQTNLEQKEFKDILKVYRIREIDFFIFLSLDILDIKKIL